MKYGGYKKSWDWRGDTALMAAAKAGNGEAVRLLLAAGAKNQHVCCYQDDCYDNSAEAAAHRHGKGEVVNIFAGRAPELFTLASRAVSRIDLTAGALPKVVADEALRVR